jgi:hypothetical protein
MKLVRAEMLQEMIPARLLVKEIHVRSLLYLTPE